MIYIVNGGINMKKIYRCKVCGNMAGKIFDSGVKMVCCGKEMTELAPQTADYKTEKHVPVVSVEGNVATVTVGSTLHPMEEDHHISFIILETNKGFKRQPLAVGGDPISKFALLDDEKVIAAYEYCNLHGFWGVKL